MSSFFCNQYLKKKDYEILIDFVQKTKKWICVDRVLLFIGSKEKCDKLKDDIETFIYDNYVADLDDVYYHERNGGFSLENIKLLIKCFDRSECTMHIDKILNRDLIGRRLYGSLVESGQIGLLRRQFIVNSNIIGFSSTINNVRRPLLRKCIIIDLDLSEISAIVMLQAIIRGFLDRRNEMKPGGYFYLLVEKNWLNKMK